MAIELDPKEIKAHLYRLGYRNISAEQLKEFIKDLKKLIKYDQHLLCTCKVSESSNNGSSYAESSLGNDKENIESYNGRLPQCCTRKINESHSGSWSHDVRSAESSGFSNITQPASLPDETESAKKSASFVKEEQTRKIKSAENHQPLKPKSSFIRPWNIQSGQQGVKRSDPVKLYHQYQHIWKQQKVPGEDRHSNLRWSIRERMLGEDPHPRPISRASSTGTLSRQQKKV